MKKPENIESLLIDYAEGHLKPEDLATVKAWLEQHPEDLELVMEWDELKLNAADSSTAASFDHLYVDEELENELFLEIEGELKPEAQERLLKDIEASAPLKREHKLFQLTRLDYERDRLNYPAKEALRKRPLVPLFRTSWIQYAAAATFVGLLLWFNTGEDIQPQYALRKSGDFPSSIQLNEEQTEIPNLPSITSQEKLLANARFESGSKEILPHQEQKFDPKKEELRTLRARDKRIDFYSEGKVLALVDQQFEENENQKAKLVQRESKTLRFNNLLSYARHLVIKQLSPGLEDKSNSEVLAGNLERISDGKISLTLDEGKLLAIQTPLVDWKRRAQ